MRRIQILRACFALTVVTVAALVTVRAQGGPKAAPEPSLKALVPKGVVIGAALNPRQVQGTVPVALDIIDRQFSTATAENVMKWGPIHPSEGTFAFEPADAFVAFGQAHGLAVIGHTLVWHSQTPRSVFEIAPGKPADRATLLARMKAHIDTVVGRYRGRVRGWDVVNEALEEDGTLRKSPWLSCIGPDFIARAFEYAHAADPDAELYYNDYNLWKPEKRAGAIKLVNDLKKQGLRVDAIGEQAHWGVAEPELSAIDATIGELAAKTGAKVMLTELDVDVLPRDPDMWGADLSKQVTIKAATNIYPNGLPEAQQQQLARRYADIFGLVLKHAAVMSRVTFWGVTDADSWLHDFPIRGRVNYPLLWDRQGKPKPAFDAVVETLRRGK